MDERVNSLKAALVAEGKRVFIVVIDDENTNTVSSLNNERDLVRLAAAVGRACERRLKR